MKWLYNTGIRIYWLSVYLASPWNSKAKQWIKGRKNWYEKIKEQVTPGRKVIWFHCASLGEFEQGRPVIEKFRGEIPDIRILLTFSSPSGYEKRKDYTSVDFVCYLPLDTKKNAAQFIDAVSPAAVIFIKYEFWYHYLHILYKRKIPLFLVSGIFRSEQLFFKWYGGWYRSFLKYFTHLYLQGEPSRDLLKSCGINNTTIAGDTRFDRVNRVVETDYQNDLLEKFGKNSKVIIAGSTWEPDEEILLYAYKKLPAEIKWIIAPHEIATTHISGIRKLFPDAVLFSKTDKDFPENARVVVVDTIGHLSYLYRYGTIAYIGGGFGKGIHNILEAATYGLPVVFGPKFKKFSEAIDLVNKKGAFPVHRKEELYNTLYQLISHQEKLDFSSTVCSTYVRSMVGATEIIFQGIRQHVTLT